MRNKEKNVRYEGNATINGVTRKMKGKKKKNKVKWRGKKSREERHLQGGKRKEVEGGRGREI